MSHSMGMKFAGIYYTDSCLSISDMSCSSIVERLCPNFVDGASSAEQPWGATGLGGR